MIPAISLNSTSKFIILFLLFIFFATVLTITGYTPSLADSTQYIGNYVVVLERGKPVFHLVFIGGEGSSFTIYVDNAGNGVVEGFVVVSGVERPFRVGPGGGQVLNVVFDSDGLLFVDVVLTRYDRVELVSVRVLGEGISLSVWWLLYLFITFLLLYFIYFVIVRFSRSVLLYPHSLVGLVTPGLVVWFLGPPPVLVLDYFDVASVFNSIIYNLFGYERFMLSVVSLTIIVGSSLFGFDNRRMKDFFDYASGVYGLGFIGKLAFMLTLSFIIGFIISVIGYGLVLRVFEVAVAVGLLAEMFMVFLLHVMLFGFIITFYVLVVLFLVLVTRRPVPVAAVLMVILIANGLPWTPAAHVGHSVSVRGEWDSIVRVAYNIQFAESLMSVAGYIIGSIILVFIIVFVWRLR